MYCLSQSDGSFLWRFDAEGGIYASPALDGGVASCLHTDTHTSFAARASSRIFSLWTLRFLTPSEVNPWCLQGCEREMKQVQV